MTSSLETAIIKESRAGPVRLIEGRGMIIYEYNGSDVWVEHEKEPDSVLDIKERCKMLTELHDCDISEINVRFTG